MTDITFTLIFLAILGISIIVHEVSHGLVADRLGDPTARFAGRLTLNPFAHIDPVGSVLLPLLLIVSGSGFLFGWAKPVPIRPEHFADSRVDEVKVALAGPLSNFALAAVAALLVRSGFLGGGLDAILVAAVQLNLVLMLFNLVPIPPLDGSRLLSLFLPEELASAIERVNPLALFFLLILLIQSSSFASWLGRTVTTLAQLLLGA